MRPSTLFSWLVCLAFIAGCGEPPPTNTAGTGPEPESTAVAAGVATEPGVADPGADKVDDAQNKATPAKSFGEWLEPPASISKRLANTYIDLVQTVIGGDQGSAGDLASMSEQMATELMQKGEQSSAYAFFGQAGRALRMAMKNGNAGVNESLIGQIFYNEACAMARAEKVDAAMTALQDAFMNGFSDFDLLASDTDLDNLRSIGEFDTKVSEWKQLAIEKIKEHAREELHHGESFPFTLALTDIEGNEQTLESLNGKVVIVDIWGTWCPPCRAEIPSFIKLQEKYGDKGFQMLGVNYEQKGDEESDLEAVVDYVADNGISYPCVMGDDATRKQIPNFRGFPTTLFIDKTGVVRLKLVGMHDYEFLDAVVAELLAEG